MSRPDRDANAGPSRRRGFGMNVQSALLHVLLGMGAVVLCSLGGSILIAIAHSIAFLWHMGPVDASTQKLLDEVIVTTNRLNVLWMWMGTFAIAVFAFRRERAPSRVQAIFIAFGAWLGPLPITLKDPEMQAVPPQLGRWVWLLIVALLGAYVGRRLWTRSERRLLRVFDVRRAASPEELVGALREAMSGAYRRIVLLAEDRATPGGSFVEADSVGELNPSDSFEVPAAIARRFEGSRERVRHFGEVGQLGQGVSKMTFWYRLERESMSPRILLLERRRHTWRRRAREPERLLPHVEISLWQQELVRRMGERERRRERKRVSYELHDTLTQGLVSGILQLDAVRSKMGQTAPGVSESLDAVERALRDSLEMSRKVTRRIHDDRGPDRDLRADLASAVEEFSKMEKITAHFEPVGAGGETSREQEACLEAALREALCNVKKHSRANFVQVTLSQIGRSCALDVRDDGRGLSESPLVSLVGRGGFGLSALRQRVQALGGRMVLESAPMQGTTLSVQFSTDGDAR